MGESHHPVPAMATSYNDELLQAHAELWNLTFSYLKSMALECAIKLGIPNAIHRCGGAASLPDLLAAVPVPESKKPYLPRLMRFLAASGVLAVNVPAADVEAGADTYRLTPLSRLLVDDEASADASRPRGSLSPFVLSQTTKYHVTAALRLPDWFQVDDGAEMPFRTAHGTDPWGVMAHDAEVNRVFNAGMGADTRFAMDFVVSKCGDVFDGITSLVDVGGGTGSAARAIAKAFRHVKCSVLDLPNVVDSVLADGVVEFISGNMMDSIPPTDAVLLKYVLHDWNDEDCVKILSQCKKAICNKPGGKVIVVDIVVGSTPSKDMFEAQVTIDLLMMVITSGKERDENEWRKLFMDAGFSRYKTRPVLGFMALTELYP